MIKKKIGFCQLCDNSKEAVEMGLSEKRNT